MPHNYTLHYVETPAELDLFWARRDRYMREDMLPNCTLKPVTEEEREWFFSADYKEHLTRLFKRKIDPLSIVFLQHNGENIGFAVYVVYKSEDGKCFILDFCVDEQYRNKGVGAEFFKLIRRHESRRAKYYALNISNQNNKRFWERNGFIKAGKDEYDGDIYEFYP
jgi:GNAT superfamily N-acetyltransferase